MRLGRGERGGWRDAVQGKAAVSAQMLPVEEQSPQRTVVDFPTSLRVASSLSQGVQHRAAPMDLDLVPEGPEGLMRESRGTPGQVRIQKGERPDVGIDTL